MIGDRHGVDRNVSLSAGWRAVYRAMSAALDEQYACVNNHAWCHGPNTVDLDASTIGACPACVAIAAANGGQQ